MKTDPQEVEQRLKQFELACRQKGVKLTHQRIEIFREVAEATDHPDTEQIYQRLKNRLPTLSLDTVYRTLWLLKDLDLLVTLGTSRERTRFDANLKGHHHQVCTKCGAISDFYSDDLDKVKLPEPLGMLVEIEATHVEVRGICRNCLKST
ncbi:MAG: transcriptional repressor [Desulfobulbaceae bacterium]|nr:MAG: transcriptional repressor [Desulfobulbaceae bacterium]